MLPVTCADEPATFDSKVRQKGLSAIDEMVGRKPRAPHSGPKRKKIAKREEGIPAKKLPPFWRDALPEMLAAYERRCAFLAMHLEHATGNPSVDHMLPKSRNWKEVYEWSNYRLCAASVNARKSDMVGVVDPFSCRDGWFAIEFTAFQVVHGPNAPAGRARQFSATLQLLNEPDCLKAREEYFVSYADGHIDLTYLERRAPFVASELRRQGLLRRGDR